MKDTPPRTLTDAEWEQRTLCSDENCIGVIGADGRCKECGKHYEGELKEAVSPAETENQTDAFPSDIVDSPAEDSADEDTADDLATDTEWESRKLCSDENCIGVIGADGRCKECGKPYEA